MKNIIKEYFGIILATAMFCSGLCAEATILPKDVLETIKKDLPNCSVRFDSLITAKDGTIYLPVIPSNPKKTATGKVVYTFPSNKTLSQKPDVVLFDSDFALLKVIKNANGKYTVTDPKNIPFVVKTGLFPQDMLVPPGLIMPEELKIMLGDLKIATEGSRVDDILKKSNQSASLQKGYVTSSFTPLPAMKSKTLLLTAINSKLLSFVSSDSVTPMYTLEMENLPKFIQPVCDDKYILVAAAGKTYIDVADVNQEVLVKKIDLSFHPSEIILSSDKTKAYVATTDEQAIFVIDLKTMELVEKIKIKGYPKFISINPDDTTIVYQDKNRGDIYTLELNETYTNKFVYNTSNISKLVIKDENIYVLSRADSNLQVIDTKKKELLYKQPVAQKPVDMKLIGGKIYILSAEGEMSIFDTEDFSINIVAKITQSGFVRKMVSVPNTNLLLITNISNKKYYVYDTVSNKVLQTVDTYVYVNDLQLINRSM